MVKNSIKGLYFLVVVLSFTTTSICIFSNELEVTFPTENSSTLFPMEDKSPSQLFSEHSDRFIRLNFPYIKTLKKYDQFAALLLYSFLTLHAKNLIQNVNKKSYQALCDAFSSEESPFANDIPTKKVFLKEMKKYLLQKFQEIILSSIVSKKPRHSGPYEIPLAVALGKTISPDIKDLEKKLQGWITPMEQTLQKYESVITNSLDPLTLIISKLNLQDWYDKKSKLLERELAQQNLLSPDDKILVDQKVLYFKSSFTDQYNRLIKRATSRIERIKKLESFRENKKNMKKPLEDKE